MFNWRFCLFCVVTVLCISLCFGSSHTQKCVETNKQALLKLKDGFIHGKHILSSWNGEDCCNWKGITCNNLTGHVTTLVLPFSNNLELPPLEIFIYAQLGGKIDSSICELQHLTILDLYYNHLEGEIPKCIGSLGQLIELNLAINGLVGFIPRTLANLSNLRYLQLQENNLVANDLEWISHLSNLRFIDLAYINLSRAIDWQSSISKIPSLVALVLEGCGLPQVNPRSILYMNSSTSLQILSLRENQLNSSILSWVFNVSKVLTGLDLALNSLHSVSDGFSKMISLKEYLDLSDNKLDGSLITCLQTLCQLKDLESLYLDNNPFSRGPLPDFSMFSSLSLKELSLRNTNIVGPLSFDHFSHLELVDLSYNYLNGSLPKVTKFASLRDLDLSNNQLSGTIPYTFGQLSNLTSLSLSSNNLNGTISEVHLLSLSRLKILDVGGNSLTFNMNPNWVPPFQLETFYASSCVLGPQFPAWLKYQTKLEMLQISFTSITDSFPIWFWNMSSSLTYLNVSHNKLSGVLPKSLPSIKTGYAGAWDLSFNNFSGPLPPFPQNLYVLFLSNNMFSGFVSSFCEILPPMDLIYLDLSSNLLAGPLQNCWEKFQSLKVLNLENNSLSGRIPKSFGTLLQILSMHLNNNNFTGEIPSLALCRSLRFIDFGDNILEGTVPTWVGENLHHLIVLRLRGNKIHGSMPTSLCNLPFLQVLDLSRNNITGKIHQCLSHIAAMSNMKFPKNNIFYDIYEGLISLNSGRSSFVDRTMLAWKGQSREFGEILGLMTMIDLSGNHLTGEIPQSITTLMALAGLNLSENNLTGLIPNNIGHMEKLESLDLSRNHLYGGIPTSFSNLSFLSYMNLSFNNLSGKIPISTQLQSFDASTYEGNVGLCGSPLTNHCPGDVVPLSGSVDKNDNNEDEDKLINVGFYISLVMGFFVGFLSVCGTLIIKSSWRHAYFKFLNNINDWIYVTVVLLTVRVKRRFQIKDYKVKHFVRQHMRQ